MKKDLTELVFILDKSGSMYGLEKDTIGGFNSMLEKQKKEKGECSLTTVLFDHSYELLHDRINIKAVRPLTEKDYRVGGSTALLDAIGKTIQKISKAQANTAEEYRAGHVMFVIMTDGLENASRLYSYEHIRKIIQKKKSAGWEFVFLGANMDAIAAASSIGIPVENAMDYIADEKGTEISYEAITLAVSQFREAGKISKACFQTVKEDTKKRKLRKNG